ncbi:MAG: kinase [Alphaproteobacteria bacterium]|nr:kinase [Alphaproteobacteria bacterium]
MSILISRTPFRISFFGGGTDYPEWYLDNGGAVLSTSINKYCYLTCRYTPQFFADTYRIVWSHIENVSHISEILHPAVREGLSYMEFEDERGVEIHHHGDLPARAGMGSSSAFANGLVLALGALKGESIDQKNLFHKAIHLERELLKENVGCQDQVATACGGLNLIRFNPGGAIDVEPVELSEPRSTELENRLMLFFVGTRRFASEIAGQVIANFDNRKDALRRIHAMVDDSVGILRGDGSLDDFGALLNETWQLKRSLSGSISTLSVDEIYEKAMVSGATGGKLLGAGASGFMLFYVPEENQENVRDALAPVEEVPFRFETEGCVIISTTDDA